MRALPLLLLIACNPVPDTIEGQVVDVWGNPVDGATVMLVGGDAQVLTGPDGRYELPRVEGTVVVKTGKKGFVQDQHEIVVEPGKRAEVPLFELFPKPEETGFYAVGAAGYQRLEARPVRQVGNPLRRFIGLPEVGDVVLETRRPRILYHNDRIRQDEIARLGLQLRSLRFVAEEQVPGLGGEPTVTVNLYVDDGGVPLEPLRPLRSRSDYLIVPREDLEPGRAYALQSQGLLTDTESFDALPDELRIAFPFTVRP